ncbi:MULTISPECIES: helix-turn-helix domain-containing protein [unclassified Cryobacterium]|uniref:helix-turn-helix domain-containing protein n=1 Tax=unclassified Cryobacterium TaxID=2649013 RepID=UPI00106D1065|nr:MULTISPECIES: helix-turn-helix domain-containing protein [unclassified Cryobacterium]TFC00258.1 helix-turn-helix domain-containing protein [Cryobacterium sp. MDB2-A-1]TFC14122.1 helix-turn-helix domain-containing protein [Cryobacterium sp. MDB2-A-2]
MSISARNWAWDLRWKRGDVSAPMKEKITLLCLAEHENPEYGYAFPSHERIAERTGQSVRTVQTHIKMLVACGVVTIEKRRGESGKWLRNVYLLEVPDTYRQKDPEWIRWNG